MSSLAISEVNKTVRDVGLRCVLMRACSPVLWWLLMRIADVDVTQVPASGTKTSAARATKYQVPSNVP